MMNTRAPDGANKLKAFVIDVKVGTVTGSIGVCSRQAPTVTRANGNVRGAAYLAWPQLERVGFSIERESQLPAPCPPGTTCTLGPDLIGCWCWLCGIVRRQRLVPCLANQAGNWLSRRLSSPTLLTAGSSWVCFTAFKITAVQKRIVPGGLF